MNIPPKLPDILIGKPRLPQSRFHREALASYHGISYADVFTQYGKLLEGVDVGKIFGRSSTKKSSPGD